MTAALPHGPSPARATPWLVAMGAPAQGGPQLVCFSHAGSGASAYRPWLTHLPAHVALSAVQLPGRETRLREAPQTGLHALASQAADALSPHLRAPFAFFGHSMGALLAYEVARRLERRGGAGPSALFVSGRRAPHLRSREFDLHDRSDETLVAELKARYGAAPSALLDDAEMRAIYLPILRADLAAIETYTPKETAPLSCPIWAFGGTEDPLTTPEELEAWRRYAGGRFSCRLFTGGHFFVQSARRSVVLAVAAGLFDELDRARVAK